MKLIAHSAAVVLALASFWVAQDGDRVSRRVAVWLRARGFLPRTDTLMLFGRELSTAVFVRGLVLLVCLGLFLGSVGVQVVVGFTWYDLQFFSFGSKALLFVAAGGLVGLAWLLYIVTHEW